MTLSLLLVAFGAVLGALLCVVVDKFLDMVNRDYRDSEDS